jgi:hypothetical protein
MVSNFSRSIKSLLLASIVFSVIGCGVPVPSFSHRVVAGQLIEANDLSFAVPGETSIDPFKARWGEPWAYYQDLGVGGLLLGNPRRSMALAGFTRS